MNLELPIRIDIERAPAHRSYELRVNGRFVIFALTLHDCMVAAEAYISAIDQSHDRRKLVAYQTMNGGAA